MIKLVFKFIIGVFLISQFLFAQSAQNTTLVGHWSNGPCRGVFAANNIAYMGNGSALKIFDVSNPAVPVFLGQWVTPGYITGIHVSGNYAYISDGYAGMRVIDVSDPTSPKEVGFYNAGGWADRIFIKGNYAYLANGKKGLRIIDISDPSNPTEIGSYVPVHWASGVYVSGNYAYLAGGGDGVMVIDISDPTQPQKVGFFWIQYQGARDVFVVGNYLYVAFEFAGLRILDISSPANPKEVGSYITGGGVIGIYVSNNFAFLTDPAVGGLVVVNVSDPTDILEVKTLLNGATWDVHVDGNYAYAAAEEKGMRIAYIKPPIIVKEVSTIDAGGFNRGLFISKDYAYLANGTRGLRILDISNPGLPQEIGSMRTNGMAYSVYVQNGFAYLADGDGLNVIDISDPASPQKVGFFASPGETYRIAVRGNYAYLADRQNGLRIIDISTPTNPQEVGFLKLDGGASRVFLKDNQAFVANPFEGIVIIDVSNPSTPQKIATTNLLGEISGMDFQGDMAYVADGRNGFHILDVGDLQNIVEVGALLQEYNNGNPAITIDVDGSYAYIGEGFGVRILDVSDPGNPKEVGFYPTSEWIFEIHVNDNYIYASGYYSGLYIIRNDLVTGIESRTAIPQDFALEQNYPNPFNPNTTIRFSLPKLATVVLKVYNLLGSEVITLVNKTYQPGKYTIGWDGKDKNGSNLASGVYLLHIQAGDFVAVRKMMLLK